MFGLLSCIVAYNRLVFMFKSVAHLKLKTERLDLTAKLGQGTLEV